MILIYNVRKLFIMDFLFSYYQFLENQRGEKMKKMKFRGIVEGFYGKPWTDEQRLFLIDFMNENDYNLYIYGPKADPYHRSKWRENYPQDEMENFEKLIKKGSSMGVDVSIAVSPGLSMSYSSEEDFETLLSKFLSFARIGSRTFSLFLDDIPPELKSNDDLNSYGSIADAQADFTNRLYNRLKAELGDINFIFCPTHYHGTSVNSYHTTLGKKVDKNIQIMWTGPEVCSEFIDEKDSQMISQAYERPVLYWDNYPVNDASMVPELHIGPYEGRSPEITKHSAGIVLNPMNQFYANMIPLKAISYFLKDSESMSAEKATETAVISLAENCSKAMLDFINANIKSPIHPEYPTLPKELEEKYKSLVKEEKMKESIDILYESGSRILENTSEIKANLDKNILADITPWLDEYELWGKVLTAIADVKKCNYAFYQTSPFEDHMPDDVIDNAVVANSKLEELLTKTVQNKTVSLGQGFMELGMQILIKSKGLVSLYRY